MDHHNINDYSQLYRCTVTGAGVTGEVVRLELDRVKAKAVRVLSHVTTENDTSAYTKCRLGIDAGGRDHYLDELQTIAAAELAISRSDIILGEGDVFFAEFTGTATGDTVIMTCVGWEDML